MLYKRIIDPVERRGYVYLSDVIGEHCLYDDVRSKLVGIGSTVLRVFDVIKSSRPWRENEPRSLEVIAKEINNYLEEMNADLIDYEKFAICFLIFRQARKKEHVTLMVRDLLEHFGLEKKYELYGKEQRLLYNKYQVEIRSVSSVKEYTRVLSDTEVAKKAIIYYRGHRSISYELLPSLFRNKGLYMNERTMYLELMTRCPEDFTGTHNHIDILAQMQHYGLPTRLLDVTSNALTALYFACESKASTYGEVVMLEIDERYFKHYQDIETVTLSSLPLLEYSDQERLFEQARAGNSVKMKNVGNALDKLKAEIESEKRFSGNSFNEMISLLDGYYLVSPQKLNRRMMNQDGAFILCGLFDRVYDPNPFERKQLREKYQLEELRVKNKDGKRIILVISNKDKIMKELNTYGVNKTRIYPEIDKVSEYIREQFEK